MIIILGGDVGGGKSTQARLLYVFFRRSNLSVTFRHIKGFHFISRIVLVIIIFLRFRNVKVLKSLRYFSPIRILYSSDVKLLEKNMILLSVLNTIDISLILLVRYYILSMIKSIIIYEDHVFGYLNDLFFINIIQKTTQNKMINKYWMVGYRLLVKSIKDRSRILIWLYAPYNKLIYRWKKRKTAPELPCYIAAGRVAAEYVKRDFDDVICINTELFNPMKISKKILMRMKELKTNLLLF